MMGRNEQRIKIQNEKKVRRKKKLLIFFLVLVFFEGLLIVDYEYSNMMGFEKEMVLGCRRLDSEMIRIYFVGNEIELNSQQIINSIQNTTDVAVRKTKVFFYKLKRKLEQYIKEDDFSPRGTQWI